MIKLLVATSNQGKVKEFNDLIKGLDHRLRLLSYNDLPNSPPKIDEPFETFYENSLQKAIESAKVLKISTLADDSGLCIDALNGAPGVYSARLAERQRKTFIPKEQRDHENIVEVLKLLAPYKNKTCHYVAAVAVAFQVTDFIDLFGISQLNSLLHVDQPPTTKGTFFRYGDLVVAVVEGFCNGKIVDTPRGDNGFGYDPIFEIEHLGQTAAEITPKEKNAISHRSAATQKLLKLLLATKKIPGHNPGI